MKRIKRENGQAAVEFALVLPVLLIILCGIIDFGWLFYNKLALSNTCREGARFAVVNTGADFSNSKIRAKINDVIPGSLDDDLDIDIVYSVPLEPLTGDVTITLTTEMPILTPVMGIFYSNQEVPLQTSVTMKVES